MFVDTAAQQVELTADHASLRNAIVERFEVFLLIDGIALSPTDENTGVRLVQLEDGTIALNGAVVSGQELRDRLGADGDLVVRLCTAPGSLDTHLCYAAWRSSYSSRASIGV